MPSSRERDTTPAAPPAVPKAAPASTGIAAFPLIRENPYQNVLYGELAARGLELISDADFKLAWLWRHRRRVGVLHFHWPQNYYLWWRPPRALRRPLSWLKVRLFALRLAVARRLGYTIAWTIHEVFPHERAGTRIDRIGSKYLARFSHVLIAHDRDTANLAARELGIGEERIDLIPHGSYIGVYPPGRPREVVRAELGIPDGSFTFLCFGHIRAYKAIEVLLDAFAKTTRPDATLVVAGVPMDDRAAAAVNTAAETDARIRPLLEFIPDERVAELFDASEVAVLPRGDGGTSGALVLALSMGVPVIAADRRGYHDLIGDDAGWLFEPGNSASLTAALERAANDPERAHVKGIAARTRADLLGWPAIAERTAALIHGRRARRGLH